MATVGGIMVAITDGGGHGLIQTQKAFWGKVHELTCPHTTYSSTALETITTISGPWHLQVRNSMGMTELTFKHEEAYDYDCFYIILQFLFLTSRAKCSSHETIAVTFQWVLSKSSCLWYVYPMLLGDHHDDWIMTYVNPPRYPRLRTSRCLCRVLPMMASVISISNTATFTVRNYQWIICMY